MRNEFVLGRDVYFYVRMAVPESDQFGTAAATYSTSDGTAISKHETRQFSLGDF